jgi:hypothetical protein
MCSYISTLLATTTSAVQYATVNPVHSVSANHAFMLYCFLVSMFYQPGSKPATGGANIHPIIKADALQDYSTKTAPALAAPAAADAYPSATGSASAATAGQDNVSRLPGAATDAGVTAANGGNSGSYSYEGTSKMDLYCSNAPSQPTTAPSAAAGVKAAAEAAPNAATGAAGAVAGAAAAAGSAVAGAVGGLVRRQPHPAALLMHQHHDRMVMFLASLVTYPFTFLLTQVGRLRRAFAASQG